MYLSMTHAPNESTNLAVGDIRVDAWMERMTASVSPRYDADKAARRRAAKGPPAVSLARVPAPKDRTGAQHSPCNAHIVVDVASTAWQDVDRYLHQPL